MPNRVNTTTQSGFGNKGFAMDALKRKFGNSGGAPNVNASATAKANSFGQQGLAAARSAVDTASDLGQRGLEMGKGMMDKGMGSAKSAGGTPPSVKMPEMPKPKQFLGPKGDMESMPDIKGTKVPPVVGMGRKLVKF